MARYAIVLDTQDRNNKALIQIIGHGETSEGCVIPYDIPSYLLNEISVGTSIVETKHTYNNEEDIFVERCHAIRPYSFSSSNNLRIRTVLYVNFKKINQLSAVTTGAVYSKEFGAVKVPPVLIPKLKGINAATLYADIELENRQDCWYSSSARWQIVPDGLLLELNSFEQDKEAPYRIDESSLRFGPFKGVVVETTPGAALIWSRKIVAVLETNENVRPGMWYEFVAKMGDSNHEFPIPCKYFVHECCLSGMPVLPTIVSDERSCGISFEVEGRIALDEKEKFHYMHTAELGDITCGITSCLLGSSLAIGEKAVAQVSLIKDDLALVLHFKSIDEIVEVEVGVFVRDKHGKPLVTVGPYLYDIDSHVRQFCDSLEVGHIIQVKFCHSRSKNRKRIYSYKILDHGKLEERRNIIRGEFMVKSDGDITLNGYKFNCYATSQGLKFIDFENSLICRAYQKIAVVWDSEQDDPTWSLDSLEDREKKSLAPSVKAGSASSSASYVSTNLMGEGVMRPILPMMPMLPVESSLRSNLVRKHCYCSAAHYKFLSRPTPNSNVDNETPYKLKLLAAEQHTHGELTIVQFFVTSVSWNVSTFVTVIFGPGFEDLPRNFGVGQWFEKTLQRVRGSGNKRFLRVKHREDWLFPEFIPEEPSIIQVRKWQNFTFITCSMNLVRKNNKEDSCGIHTVLHSALFGPVIANGEDHFCDPIGDNIQEVHYSGFAEPLSTPLRLGKFTFYWRITRSLEVVDTVYRMNYENETSSRTSWDAQESIVHERLVDAELDRTSAQEKEKKRKEKLMKQKYKEMNRVSKMDRIEDLQMCFDIIEESLEQLKVINANIEHDFAIAKLGFDDKLRKKSQRITIGAKFLFDVLSDRDYYVALQISIFDGLRTLRNTLQGHYSYLVKLPGADIASIQSFTADL